ncbi:hypothetical protein EJ357_44350 [Streptomyces cyaneochromogenes]|uniref:Uncharacterized protein n=1 Tax=Streptomyces cyaneochromogenes TaxID=2496836 RepID=A0A3S9MKD8_9ACTN|nr:hypothetical protein EJ357_44350 [Streptomyces cyaneochromogenes]
MCLIEAFREVRLTGEVIRKTSRAPVTRGTSTPYPGGPRPQARTEAGPGPDPPRSTPPVPSRP